MIQQRILVDTLRHGSRRGINNSNNNAVIRMIRTRLPDRRQPLEQPPPHRRQPFRCHSYCEGLFPQQEQQQQKNTYPTTSSSWYNSSFDMRINNPIPLISSSIQALSILHPIVNLNIMLPKLTCDAFADDDGG
jgi:hypothetical protein